MGRAPALDTGPRDADAMASSGQAHRGQEPGEGHPVCVVAGDAARGPDTGTRRSIHSSTNALSTRIPVTGHSARSRKELATQPPSWLALGFHRARMGGRNVAGLTARLSVTKVLRSCNTRHRITAGLRWLGVREVTQ